MKSRIKKKLRAGAGIAMCMVMLLSEIVTVEAESAAEPGVVTETYIETEQPGTGFTELEGQPAEPAAPEGEQQQTESAFLEEAQQPSETAASEETQQQTETAASEETQQPSETVSSEEAAQGTEGLESTQLVTASVQPLAASSLPCMTKEEVEKLSCSGSGSEGTHVLAERNSIVKNPDGTKLLRASLNRREFPETCTYTEGKSEDRACKYCNQWFTIVEGHEPKETSHQYEEGETVTGCDGARYTTKVCSKCGSVEVTVTGETDPSRHTQVTTTVKSSASCDKEGVTVTECTECHAVLSCTVTPAAGHAVHEQTVQNPTCLQDGISRISCMQCSYSREEKIPGLGKHTKSTVYTVPPTCTEPGKKITKCSGCGEVFSEEEEVEALGHDFRPVSDSKHPCTEPIGTMKCTRCGLIQEETAAPGHKPGEQIYTVEPTCGTAGYSYQICTVCGEKIKVEDSEKPASGEHRMTIQVIHKLATCGESGSYSLKCSKCGYVSSEIVEVPATGNHFYNAADYSSCEARKVCVKCGYVAKEASEHVLGTPKPQTKTTHKRSCTVPGCKYSVIEECIGIDDHDCTTDVKCACGNVTKEGNAEHSALGAQYQYNESNHYMFCSSEGCEAIVSGPEPHVFGEVGTETEFVCTVCGYEKADKHDHVFEKHSDVSLHWDECTVCHIRKNYGEHDRKASDGYDGNCLEAVKCSVCGYDVLPARGTHTWETDQWHQNVECHYQTCMEKGCDQTESYEHKTVTDRDCTTPDLCLICGYEIVAASASHSWVVAEEGHTGTGHKRVCSVENCDAEEMAAHEAGMKATCCEQAECLYCHTHFGGLDPENHVGDREIRDAKAATTEEDGYTGDLYCKSCNAILEKGTVIPKLEEGHVHTFDSYAADGEGHWKICGGCGEKEKENSTPHTFGDYVPDEEHGGHRRTCEVCGYMVSGSHEHEAENYDCTKPLCCIFCGEIVVAAQESHNFTGRVVSTGEGHATECVNRNCKVVSEPMEHSGGAATCKNGAHCQVCGEEYTVPDSANHVGGEEIRGQKNATETEEGYTGDTYCLGCGELIRNGSVIEALSPEHEHVFGNWLSDATHHWKQCECGDIFELGEHAYKDRVCIVCGAATGGAVTGEDVLLDVCTGGVVTVKPEENEAHYRNLELVAEEITDSVLAEKYETVKAAIGSKYREYFPLDLRLVDSSTHETVAAGGKMTVKLFVPDGWTAAETAVYYVSDQGTEEKMAVTPSEDGSHVLFTTDHFSIYVLVRTSTQIQAPASSGGGQTAAGGGTGSAQIPASASVSPKTGDGVGPAAVPAACVLFLLAASIGTAAAYMRRKKYGKIFSCSSDERLVK